MKKGFRYLLLWLMPAVFVMYVVSCNLKQSANVVLDVAAAPFAKLSEYNFFAGAVNQLVPNERVIPYDLITPLFTDYAHK
ncbi:MAG TPA: hypothetical protein PLW44_16465, partial [Chitinophagales bacterium]|nr:hypothetical protein [Chitinophagales bacterium]